MNTLTPTAKPNKPPLGGITSTETEIDSQNKLNSQQSQINAAEYNDVWQKYLATPYIESQESRAWNLEERQNGLLDSRLQTLDTQPAETKPVEIGGVREIDFGVQSEEFRVKSLEVETERVAGPKETKGSKESNVDTKMESTTDKFEFVKKGFGVLKGGLSIFGEAVGLILGLLTASPKARGEAKFAATVAWSTVKEDMFGLYQDRNKKKDDKKDDKKKKPLPNMANFISRPGNPLLKKIRASKVNPRLRGIGNKSYEGVVDDQGQIRVDIEADLARAEAERTQDQEKSQRGAIAAPTAKRKQGQAVIFDLNKGAESHNSVTQLKG